MSHFSYASEGKTVPLSLETVSTVEALLAGRSVTLEHVESCSVQQLVHDWQPPPPSLSPPSNDRIRPVSPLENACESWQSDLSEGLSTLLLWLFEHTGLLECLDIDRERFAGFCEAIEDSYGDHPYHNSAHVTSVLHMMHMILTKGGVGDVIRCEWRPVVLAAAYITTAVHDADHHGLTNDFLCRMGHDLSIQYHQTSCNEHHHVDVGLHLVESWLAERLTEPVRVYLRTVLIRMVLATDLTRHTEVCRNFAAQSEKGAEGWKTSNATTLALQMALKCADLGHLTLARDTHVRWVQSLQEEFLRQDGLERQMGHRVLANDTMLSQSQVSFYDDLALPMYETLVGAFPKCRPLLQGARLNRDFWSRSATQNLLQGQCKEGMFGGPLFESCTQVTMAPEQRAVLQKQHLLFEDFFAQFIAPQPGAFVVEQDAVNAFTKWRQQQGQSVMQLVEMDAAKGDVRQVFPPEAYAPHHEYAMPDSDCNLSYSDVYLGYVLNYDLPDELVYHPECTQREVNLDSCTPINGPSDEGSSSSVHLESISTTLKSIDKSIVELTTYLKQNLKD